MDIQSATAHAPAPGPSITDLAQQHGVSRESLLAFVRSKIQQAQQAEGEAPLDDATLERVISQTLDHGNGQAPGDGAGGEVEETAPARYTSSARVVPGPAPASGRISVLA